MTDRAVRAADGIQTPAYVYDLDEVERAHALLRAALPVPSELLYSVKANPHPAIARALAASGCGAEVSSTGELALALDAGVDPERIQYTGPAKPDADVEEAVKAGVGRFSVDSPAGVEQVTRAAEAAGRAATILLRVNGAASVPRQGLAMTGLASQFGMDAELVAAGAAALGDVAGFHLYVGSDLRDEAALLAQFDAAIASASELARVLGRAPTMLNLGGGFGAPYARAGDLPRFPGLARALAGRLDAAFPGWRRGAPAIVFESGRYLTGTCGELLTRVLDVRQSHGRPVVILESGINHLGGMSGLRRLPQVAPELDAADDRRATLHHAIVAGPLCTPLDTWARAADVPAVRPGEVVRVPNVGAYGLSASLVAFLGHPAPREVVVARGAVVDVSQIVLVRRGAQHDGGM